MGTKGLAYWATEKVGGHRGFIVPPGRESKWVPRAWCAGRHKRRPCGRSLGRNLGPSLRKWGWPLTNPTQQRKLSARATVRRQAAGWGRGLPGVVSKQQPPIASRESHQTIIRSTSATTCGTTLRFRQLSPGRALCVEASAPLYSPNSLRFSIGRELTPIDTSLGHH